MINNPVTFSIDYLADASKDIPNMVVQLSFLVMSGIIVMVFAFAKDLNQARKGGDDESTDRVYVSHPWLLCYLSSSW